MLRFAKWFDTHCSHLQDRLLWTSRQWISSLMNKSCFAMVSLYYSRKQRIGPAKTGPNYMMYFITETWSVGARQLVSQGEKFTFCFSSLNFLYDNKFFILSRSFFCFFSIKATTFAIPTICCVKMNGISCRFPGRETARCRPLYATAQRFFTQDPLWSFSTFYSDVLALSSTEATKKIFQLCMWKDDRPNIVRP